jgi:hypothetical protein
MKTVVVSSFFIILSSLAFTGLDSCREFRKITAAGTSQDSIAHHREQLAVGLSGSPNQFHADAQVIHQSAPDSLNQHTIYQLLINQITERGAAVTAVIGAGDTIQAELTWATHDEQKKWNKNQVMTVVIEERQLLNSDHPVFLLKTIRQK